MRLGKTSLKKSLIGGQIIKDLRRNMWYNESAVIAVAILSDRKEAKYDGAAA